MSEENQNLLAKELFTAVSHRLTYRVGFMLKCGTANPNNPYIESKSSNFPILIAARKNLVDILDMLIDAGADLTIINEGYNILHETIFGKSLKALQTILARGNDKLNINEVDLTGRTPASYAAWYGYDDLLQCLIGKGADLNIPDNSSYFPLHYAIGFNIVTPQLNTIILLLENGADVDAVIKNGNTALHMVCSYGQFDVICLLLRHNANINALNKRNQTPLEVLREECELDAESKEIIADFLITYGAKTYDTLKAELDFDESDHVVPDIDNMDNAGDIELDLSYADL